MTYFLIGERVGLRSLRATDADGPYPDWLNDAEVCEFNSHHVYPYDREQARAYIDSVRGSRRDLVLAIEDLKERTHLGNISLQSLHPISRSAEFAILLGDRSAWGKGIGAEAGKLIVRHGFAALGLNRIACGTTADNIGMQKLAIKLGMRAEGRRRNAAFKNGAWVDVLEYGLLAGETIP